MDKITINHKVILSGRFVRDNNLISQLGYKVIIANESTRENDFIINGNLIYQSLTKSKRVT